MSDNCEKCGVPLSEEDFVPCDLDGSECPLLRSYNKTMERAIENDRLGRVPTTCIERAYGSTYRLPFQIKVF